MSRDLDLTDFEYTGDDPFSTEPGRIQLGESGIRFDLPRTKRKKKYRVLFDAKWSEVVSFECCEINYCQDDKSWPLREELPADFKSIGEAGLLFMYLIPDDEAHFQIWGSIPLEDVPTVQNLVEKYSTRPSLAGLAHHGTAAAVRYMINNCEIIHRRTAKWHDWAKKGVSTTPQEKLKEKAPEYVYCKEGMAIDFYGANVQLEQMATFWPWRLIKEILLAEYELHYRWHEDYYTFYQQVWDEEERHEFYHEANDALQIYHSSEDATELLQIRPWSFPSKFHRSWDKLDPFSSKASRNGFPPIFDFEE